MVTYRFTMSERELEVILAALGLMSRNGHKDDIEEARALQLRLDREADEQFLKSEYPQHAG